MVTCQSSASNGCCLGMKSESETISRRATGFWFIWSERRIIMLKQFPTNHLLYGGLLVMGFVLVLILSLSGATGALAESAQPDTSCKTVSTPYQLKVPFGLEDDLKQYVPKDNPLT